MARVQDERCGEKGIKSIPVAAMPGGSGQSAAGVGGRMTRGVGVGSAEIGAADESAVEIAVAAGVGVVVGGGGGAVATGVAVGIAANIGGAAVGRGVAVGGEWAWQWE